MEWKNYTNNTYPWPMLSMWPLSVFWPWPFPLLRSTFLVWLPFRTLFILIFYLKRQDQITWLIVKKVPTTERRLKELTAICKDCIPTSVAIRTCSAIFQWWESNKIKWQQKYFHAPRTFNFISLNLYIIDYSSRYAKVIVNVCNKTAIFFFPTYTWCYIKILRYRILPCLLLLSQYIKFDPKDLSILRYSFHAPKHQILLRIL